jgi:hypothetical protein
MAVNDPHATTTRADDGPALSGWAATGITFAAMGLLLIGLFQLVAGLAAIIDDDFFVVTRNYAFDIDTTTWGWIHLLIGVVALGVGAGLIGQRLWAVVGAIAIAMLSAFANFLFIPYYPLWSLLVIAVNLWVIWALTRPGAIRD